MLKRSHRFHGYNSLNHAYRSGKTVRDELLGLRFALNSRRQEYRCAVVVSKKVSKSAVVRNRIRRRIFNILAAELPENTGSFDIVITVFSEDTATLPNEQLISRIRRLIKDAHLGESGGHGTIEEKER